MTCKNKAMDRIFRALCRCVSKVLADSADGSFLVVTVAYGCILDAEAAQRLRLRQTCRSGTDIADIPHSCSQSLSFERCLFLIGLPDFVPCKDLANAISYGQIPTYKQRLLFAVNGRRMS